MSAYDASRGIASKVSPDSGLLWTEPGAWPVAPGVHRVPLPLPMDGLRAVNVYVLETGSGLTLVDGGWAVAESRAALDAALAQVGASVRDITDFLVTHVHRDHYTQAVVVRGEVGSRVSLGVGDRPTLELMDGVSAGTITHDPTLDQLRLAGAFDAAKAWEAMFEDEPPEPELWGHPDTWLEGEVALPVGDRVLDAVPTPGHTAGHYVFADRAGGVLFAGDHVLPHITPSIGFEPVPVDQPLGDFLRSLAVVRALPDLALLPAHGPVGGSTHQRVDELLAHHEVRLAASRAAVAAGGSTALEVARGLTWTSRATAYDDLDVFNGALAAMETKAHLDLLVARGELVRTDVTDGGVTTASYAHPAAAPRDV